MTDAIDSILSRLKLPPDEAERFLMALDEGAETFCFQAFDDDQARKKARTARNKGKPADQQERDPFARTLHGTLTDRRQELTTLNGQGAGIFAAVNEVAPGKARTADNITGVRAVFADFDPPATMAPPETWPLEPSLLVESSPGKLHAYWFVDGMAVEEFSAVQQALIKVFGSDKSIQDLPRVMRLPGFFHMKDPNARHLVNVTNESGGLPYTADAIKAAFPPVRVAKSSAKPTPDDDPVVVELRKRELLKQQRVDGGWNIVCPWTAEHTAASSESSTTYFPAHTGGYKGGGFKCQHDHCAERTVAGLRGYLGLAHQQRTPPDEEPPPWGVGDAPDDWPEPLPLPALRPPVPPFDPELLPDRLRPWLSDIAERMQCPPEFPAVSALVSLASLVGRQVGIMPKRYDDWLVVPNLWGAVVGRPGIMKTPALDEPMKPLHRLKEAAREDHGREMEDCEVALDVHQAKLDAAKSKLTSAAKKGGDVEGCAAALRNLREGELKPPTMRRYLTNDATPEKLGELLSENPTGMLVYRDELVSWLKGLDREGREEGRGFYLQGWNGTGSYTFDRIIRGTVHIEAVCVSMLGGIQPGPLSDYVYHATHNGSGNDGLLQRFQLLVWPISP